MTPRRLLAALAAAALLLVGWAVLHRPDGPRAGTGPGGAPGTTAPPVVTVAEVVRGPFVARIELVGTLEARSAAELYARSAGPLVAIAAEVGDRVRRGQVLARIEPAEERERVEQGRANLKMAEATLAQRHAALAIAGTTAERTRALFEQSLVSRQQLDAVEADLSGVRAQVQVASAQIEQARAALSSSQVELDQTLVTAPFDGVVGRRYLDLGELAAANAPVFQVVDLSTIRTTVDLPERQAAQVRAGQDATVRVDSLGGVVFPGRVARVSDVFDPRSNTTEAQIEVPNPGRRLKPGMFATVTVALDERAEAWLVPETAVLEEDGQSWVFRVEQRSAGGGTGEPSADEEAGTADTGAAGLVGGEPPTPRTLAHRVQVQVLGRAPITGSELLGKGTAPARPGTGRIAVAGDLASGDRVVTLGHEALADGDTVTLAGATGPAGSGARAAE